MMQGHDLETRHSTKLARLGPEPVDEAIAAAGSIEVVTNHGIAHDAAGYLLNYQGIGPGYQYVLGNSGLFFSTSIYWAVKSPA